MKIQNLIETFLNEIPKIYSEGLVISKEQFLTEYKALKSELMRTCEKESIVAIKFDKNYRYMLSILVCMDAGICYVPLRIDFPQERITQIQEISGFSFIIDDDYLDNCPGSQEFIKGYEVSENDVLYILFTSGSTGKPKGVEIQRKSCENFFMWLDSLKVNKNDILINSTEFIFDVSLVDVGLFILKQPTILFSKFKNNIFKLLLEIDEYKVTTIATVPNNFSMILTDELMERFDISSLKNIYICGSRFSENLYKNFINYLPKAEVYNCYGPTEFTVYCLVRKFDRSSDLDKGNVSVGKVILNTKSKVINSELQDTDPYEEGELVLSGVQIMKGYKNRPELTNEVFLEIDGKVYYKTGNLAFLDKEGSCFVTGRTDDTIKVMGFRVNLSDVDAYIHRLSYVTDSVTVFVEQEDMPSYLASFILLNDTSINIKEIMNDLKSSLPSFQLPKKISVVETYPLNNSGKVCKKTLKTML